MVQKENTALWGYILLKFFMQYLLVDSSYELQRDEFLHLDQGNHLAWGYISVPPVTSWISFVILKLGGSIFWVRFFPALFGAMTLAIVWKATKLLGGNFYSLILGATCILFSVLLRLNILYQPNSLDVLCWTACYLILIYYIHSENPKWLYTGAFVFALGFLNKYNIVFLLLGIFPALLITDKPKIWLNKHVFFALIFGILLILPNLYWQYENGFPVIYHLNELASRQLVNVDRWLFLRSQVVFFLGSLPVIGIGLYALAVFPPFKKYRPFLVSIFLTLLIFMYFRAKDYYAIGIYPIYIAFGSAYLSQLTKPKGIQAVKIALIVIPLLVFIPMYHYLFPNKTPEYILANNEKYQKIGLLRWEDGKDHALPQDFADMLGWEELAEKVDRAFLAVADPTHTIVICDNYGQAGAINYYTKLGIKAVSFNADYINWFELNRKYTNLIRVKTATGKDKELEETSPYFENAYVADSITNSFAREYGTTIFVFELAKIDIKIPVSEEIKEIKKRYVK